MPVDPFQDLLRQTSLTVSSFASLLRRSVGSPWCGSSGDVLVTVPTGATSAQALHGLGRAMNGAAVVGCTSAAVGVSVDLPGSDSDLYVTVRLSAASGAPFVVKLRCY